MTLKMALFLKTTDKTTTNELKEAFRLVNDYVQKGIQKRGCDMRRAYVQLTVLDLALKERSLS